MAKRNSKGDLGISPKNMVCVVPKQNVEILGRALHALARIGEELYVEPVDGGLTFRTVHSNHSVYAEVHFTDQFFSYYSNPVPDTGDENELRCRINMKSYLAAFRSLPCLRKQVETCLLEIQPTWLIVKFRCHHNLIRTYRLPVIESETLQALYTVDEVPNNLLISADVFAGAVKNFQFSERDITLAVEHRKAVLRNYVPGGTDPSGVVRSELKLDAGEFTSYSIGQETAITFCLKAFRAVLYFSEPVNLPLAVKFSTPGSPVVIISKCPTYELRFVLSSLAPEDCDVSRNESQQLLTPLRSLQDREKRQQLRKQHTPGNDSANFSEAWSVAEKPTTATRGKASTIPEKGRNKKAAPSRPSLNVDVSNHLPSNSQRVPNRQGGAGPSHVSSQRSTVSAASSTGAVVGTAASSAATTESDKAEPLLQWNLHSSKQNVILTKRNENTKTDLVIPCSDPEDEEEGDEDILPGTPPPPMKKARHLFPRCFEPTLTADALIRSDDILAYDSDEG